MINYYEKVKANPQIYKQITCKELLFANYTCPVELNKMDKWSHYHYILYVQTGKLAVHTPGRDWTLTRGKAIFMKKGSCIMEKFFDEDLCVIVFFIPDNYLCNFLRENSAVLRNRHLHAVSDEPVIPIEVNDMLAGYYDSVLPYFDTPEQVPENMLELKFRELLFNIITNPLNNTIAASLQSLLIPKAESLQPVMEANCYANLHLQEYARLCNRSLSSFKRDFFKVYGTAPASWLMQRRLAYAMQLLVRSDKAVKDISFESGFENNTHFSRVFKEKYGLSPLKYRMQYTAGFLKEQQQQNLNTVAVG